EGGPVEEGLLAEGGPGEVGLLWERFLRKNKFPGKNKRREIVSSFFPVCIKSRSEGLLIFVGSFGVKDTQIFFGTLTPIPTTDVIVSALCHEPSLQPSFSTLTCLVCLAE